MKLAEVTLNTSNQTALFEALDANNDTNFVTNDLVKIVNAHTGTWQEVTDDEFDTLLDRHCTNG